MKSPQIVAAAILTTALLIGCAEAQPVSIVTTPIGSFTNSAGVAIAKVISDATKIRVVVQAQAREAVVPVEAGNANFGMGDSFTVTFFTAGTGDYEGQGKHPDLRQVAPMTTARVALYVRADSPIKTIADLKGKRVSAGFNAQKNIGRTIEALLANAGLTYNDVQQVLTPNVSRAADDFIGGKTDVLFFALGSAKVKQAAATVGGLRVLPIDVSPAAVARMQTILPGSYVLDVKPAPNLDGIEKPTNVIAFDMVLFTRKDLPDDIAYAVAKTLHDHKQELVAVFKPMALFQPDKMAKPLQGVPFHPGAMKYYEEIGIAPKH
jgi:uncharacterized protein